MPSWHFGDASLSIHPPSNPADERLTDRTELSGSPFACCQEADKADLFRSAHYTQREAHTGIQIIMCVLEKTLQRHGLMHSANTYS